MRLLPALMLAVVATAPVAFAQPQNEPRLAGGPERVCSEDDIRRALAGSYTGPPCRFTDMPDGMDAAAPQPDQRPQEMSTDIRPVPPRTIPSVALPSQPELARPVSYAGPVAQPRPVHRSTVIATQQSGNAFLESQQSASWRAQTTVRQWPPQSSAPVSGVPPRQPPAGPGETVRLDDSFFSGALVGGVERPFTPLYGYRGLILIAADGEVRSGNAGLQHRVLRVRAMDHRTAPVPHTGPRRVYPYP
jgi:hypothetical protein